MAESSPPVPPDDVPLGPDEPRADDGAQRVNFVLVSELFDLKELDLHVLCGEEHLDRRITHPRVQKPGLAFAGYYRYIKEGRVQIVGESEIAYLDTIDPGERRQRFARIVDLLLKPRKELVAPHLPGPPPVARGLFGCDLALFANADPNAFFGKEKGR